MRDFTGQKLGAYQLGGQVRADAFSTTYSSYQTTTRRAVAVKVLSEELGQKSGFIERFSRDMSRVAQLNDANIVPVYDVGVAGANAYVVTRLLTGGTLEGHAFSSEEALNALRELAHALDVAHQHGVIHGNLSPSVILLENDRALISDLGLAKVLTESGAFIQPTPYFATEQWRSEPITPRTDIYALGVMAFEIFTGRLPFEGTGNALMRRHLNEEPPLASGMQPGLPTSLDTVLGRALAKDPDLRYASASDFVEALGNAFSGQAEIASSDSSMPAWLSTPSESSWGDAGWDADSSSDSWDDTPTRSDADSDQWGSSWGEADSSWGQSDDSQDMSYADWERHQAEVEAAQAKANEPDIPLPDFPDMFEETPSTRPSTGSLSGGDYVPEWFMGVEELKDEDVPDFLRGATLDDSLLNPLGKGSGPLRPSGPLTPPPPLPVEPVLELPDFDDFGDFSVSDEPQIRRLEETGGLGEEALSLDDLLFEDEEESTPQIRRLDAVESSEEAVALDDLFFDEDEESSESALPDWGNVTTPTPDLRSTSELTSIDAEDEWLTAAPDSLALNISSMLGDELPSTGELAFPSAPTWAEEQDDQPAEDVGLLDFRAEDDLEPQDELLDWLPQTESSLLAEPDNELDFLASEEATPDWMASSDSAADSDWLPQTESSLLAEPDNELDFLTAEEATPDWLSEAAPPSLASELDDLFDLNSATPEREFEMPATGDLTASSAIEDSFADLFPAETELETSEPAWDAEAAPDWLAGYDHEQESSILASQSMPALEFEEPLALGDTPEWFGELDFANLQLPDEPKAPVEAVVAPPETAAEFESFDVDDFLNFEDVNVDDVLGRDSTTLDSPHDFSMLDEDDFLADFPVTTPADELEPASDLPFELPTEIEEELILEQSEALPEWMKRAAATSSEQVSLKVGSTEVRVDQIPDIALPEELRQLREQMQNLMRQGNGGLDVPKSGVLAGIEGALPPETWVSTPGEITLGRTVRPTETQQERVASLQQVMTVAQQAAAQKAAVQYGLEEDEEPKPEGVKRPRRRTKIKRDRLAITLLMLAIIFAPFLTDALHLAADPATALDEDAQPLALAIDDLGAARQPLPVLVAFEYSPTSAGELDPLAEAVLRDVIANGGRPVVISTHPLGLLHAEQVFRTLSQDAAFEEALGRELAYGQDYLILRLLSGGSVGVRQLSHSEQFATTIFSQDIQGDETGLEVGLPEAEDFAFLLVIGERDEDTRTWAEQFTDSTLPKFALVTAAAAPMTRPYVSANAYQGMVVGIEGTLTYDTVRNAGRKDTLDSDTLPDPALSRWHSLALGLFVATLIILGGTLFNFIRFARTWRA